MEGAGMSVLSVELEYKEKKYQVMDVVINARALCNYTRDLYVKGRVPRHFKECNLADLSRETKELYKCIRSSTDCFRSPVPKWVITDIDKKNFRRQRRERALKLARPALSLIDNISYEWEILLGIDANYGLSTEALQPLPEFSKRREHIFNLLGETRKCLWGYIKWLE